MIVFVTVRDFMELRDNSIDVHEKLGPWKILKSVSSRKTDGNLF